MYVSYWRLQEEPFIDALDLRYFYQTPQHEEGLARLLYVARQRKSGAVLTGEYGAGKSLVCQMFLQRLSKVGCFSVVVLENPMLSAEGLWRELARQLRGCQDVSDDMDANYQQVVALLNGRHQQGGHGIVIVEEAQLLAHDERMERIRLLMNIRDKKGYPLLTLILVGAPEIVQYLSRNVSMRQRMHTVWNLKPLTRDQVRAYLDHRLRLAGGNAWIFDESAVDALYTYSQGIPRLINGVADMALYLGMVESAVHVDQRIVERVVADMQFDGETSTETGGV